MHTFKTSMIFRIASLATGICFFTHVAHAQFPTLKDATNALREGTEAVRQFGNFVHATKKTTAEFNKSITVVKEGQSPTSVPPDQLTKPKFKHGKFVNFTWEPVAQFDNQVFPAMIISMATYKGEINDQMMNAVKSSALGFYFHTNQSFIPVKWEIECVDKSYFDKIGGDYVLQRKREDLFMPPIPWNMATLAKQSSSTPINIIYRLYDDEGNKEEQTQTIFLRSVNDCIFRYQQKDFNFLFTAFIQEQHPEVDKILKDALKTKFISLIDGVDGGKEKTMWEVCAVWKVLHDRGFQYSNVATNSNNFTENISSQQVRTFANAIKTNQANCVDGTVVFATILRAMGISTVLELTNEHCFLGFYTNNQRSNIVYLETTMLSSTDQIDKAKYSKSAKQKKDAYKAQFDEAVGYAAQEHADYKAANDLIEIDVDYYRNYVRPLPFK